MNATGIEPVAACPAAVFCCSSPIDLLPAHLYKRSLLYQMFLTPKRFNDRKGAPAPSPGSFRVPEKCSLFEFVKSLAELILRVHDDRPVPRHRLVKGVS